MAARKLLLVTGATGFIAKHVVREALQRGYAVRGTVRSLSRGEEVRDAVAPYREDSVERDADLSFVAADLTSDDGWADAMRGVDALIHTASPFPAGTPSNPDELIRPAVDGTRRALEAAADAGVKRVVLTSSFAAIGYGHAETGTVPTFSEKDWTNPDAEGVRAYTQSKTLAEREAWKIADARGLDLSTINPTLVLGPALDKHFGTSLDLVEQALTGKLPALPRVMFGFVDVRDIATLHINALESDAAIGKRFLGAEGVGWFREIGAVLKAAYPNYPVGTREAPDWLIRVAGLFMPSTRTIVPDLGRQFRIDNSAAREFLGRDFLTLEEMLKASAESLFDAKVVARK